MPGGEDDCGDNVGLEPVVTLADVVAATEVVAVAVAKDSADAARLVVSTDEDVALVCVAVISTDVIVEVGGTVIGGSVVEGGAVT